MKDAIEAHKNAMQENIEADAAQVESKVRKEAAHHALMYAKQELRFAEEDALSLFKGDK